MRTQNATYNSIINISSFIILLIPSFLLKKSFLDTLDENFIGLHYLFQNVIGFLSIMELGVGSTIIYALYKQISQSDETKTRYLHYVIVLIISIQLYHFAVTDIKENNQISMFILNILISGIIITITNTLRFHRTIRFKNLVKSLNSLF